MSFHPELIIRFPSEHPEKDLDDIKASLGPAFDVGVYVEMPGLPFASECKLFVRPRSEGILQDNGFVAVTKDCIERWLEGRRKPDSVDCIDSDGELLATIRSHRET
jgi:hypothetical protein